MSRSRSEIESISDHELFLVGVVLYWAEGAKEKDSRPGSGLDFINMDPRIIKVFIIWLQRVCKVHKNMIIFVISIHQTHKHRIEEVCRYWSHVTGFPISSFSKVQWKKSTVKTNRKNVDKEYYGALKIRVRRSSSLVREISGWSEGIFEKVVCK
jgi:hypothetical protein